MSGLSKPKKTNFESFLGSLGPLTCQDFYSKIKFYYVYYFLYYFLTSNKKSEKTDQPILRFCIAKA